MDTQNLSARIRNSDKEAFNLLFTALYAKLCRFAYVVVQNREVAEEVVQDVFVHLWETRSKLRVGEGIDRYLFVSVRNKAITYLRQLQARTKYEADIPTPDTTTSTFNSEQFMLRLHKAVGQLPEQCRMAYHLRYFEGLTYDEISGYLEISERTVENQLRIALSKLKQMLQPYVNEFYADTYFES